MRGAFQSKRGRITLGLLAVTLAACTTAESFKVRSDYPPDPWVEGYADPNDCLGGENLAAIHIPMPKYPKKAWNGGQQGWTIMRLDVDAAGRTQNVTVERAVPEGLFSKASLETVKGWRFEVPQNGPLNDCRILIRYRLGSVSLG